MSPSERPVPPEVLAIAVALAVAWQDPAVPEEPAVREPSPWRWGGRRWERPAGYRWS
ncbi:MAG TPA: hypothetical protein VHF27_05335 [Acidimicrobiales bacterium]|nr:hypothetical protein [Acidimicrobiales bacterium]